MLLSLNLNPMAIGRDSGVDGNEINFAHIRLRRYVVPRKEIEHRRPVHAAHAGRLGIVPPVARAGLLVILHVVVKLLEQVAHLAGLGHGDVVVLLAVQDIHALVQVVPRQRQRITGPHRSLKHK